jgi:hypothetical protein
MGCEHGRSLSGFLKAVKDTNTPACLHRFDEREADRMI